MFKKFATAALLNLFCILSVQAGEYSKWVKNEKDETYTCEYKYANKSGGYSTQKVVVHYNDPARKNWAYYYNSKKEPWGRCAVYGNPKYDKNVMYWQQLNEDKKGYKDYPEKGYCPTPGDGKEPVSDLPLPPA
jgi:hypothetical protein